MSSVIVKPRAGNRSAQLVMSIMNKRVNRKLPTSIGSVKHGASLETGEGFTFKRGYALDSLTDEDRAKIAAWLATAGKADVTRPTLTALSAKLDQVLELLNETPAPCVPHELTPARADSDEEDGSAMSRLERAIDEALAELTAQVDALKKAGVRLTRKSHVFSTPCTPDNRLDQLQAWTNRFRNELVPKFQRTCQDIGLWKMGSSSDTP